ASEHSALPSLAAELEDVLARRGRAESLLTGGGRDARLALRGAVHRIGVRHESAQRLLGELQGELAEARRAPTGPTPAELGRAADDADADARAAVREQEDLEARVTLARERLATLEQSLAEREGLPPAARALAEEGEQLALQLLEVDPGSERSVAAALSHRASAVVADTPARGLELVVKAMHAGLGSLLVLVGRDPRELVDLPVVERDELLAARAGRLAGELREIGGREAELRRAAGDADARALAAERRAGGRRAEAGGDTRELLARAEELSALAGEAGLSAEAAAERARSA